MQTAQHARPPQQQIALPGKLKKKPMPQPEKPPNKTRTPTNSSNLSSVTARFASEQATPLLPGESRLCFQVGKPSRFLLGTPSLQAWPSLAPQTARGFSTWGMPSYPSHKIKP